MTLTTSGVRPVEEEVPLCWAVQGAAACGSESAGDDGADAAFEVGVDDRVGIAQAAELVLDADELGDGNVWLMDIGRPPLWMPPGRAPQRAFRFSIDDRDSSDVIEASRNFVQMMVFADTGELVLEDSALPRAFGGETDASAVVVVDIESGDELGRAATGAPTLGMFLCPGFERDFYVASIPGALSRVWVT